MPYLEQRNQESLDQSRKIKLYWNILMSLSEFYRTEIGFANKMQALEKSIQKSVLETNEAGNSLLEKKSTLFNETILPSLHAMSQDTLTGPGDFKKATSDYFPKNRCCWVELDPISKQTYIERLGLISEQAYIDKINEITRVIQALEKNDDKSKVAAMSQWAVDSPPFQQLICRIELIEVALKYIKQAIKNTDDIDNLQESKRILSTFLEHTTATVNAANKSVNTAAERPIELQKAIQRLNRSKRNTLTIKQMNKKLGNILPSDTLERIARQYDFLGRDKCPTSWIIIWLQKLGSNPSRHNPIKAAPISSIITHPEPLSTNKTTNKKDITSVRSENSNIDQTNSVLSSSTIIDPDLPPNYKVTNENDIISLVRPDSVAESGYGSSDDSPCDSATSSKTARSSLATSISESISLGDSLSIKSQDSDVITGTHAVVNNHTWPQASVGSIAAQRPYSASAISLNAANPSEPEEAAHAQLASQSIPHKPTFSSFKLYNASHLTILNKQRQAELSQTTPVTLGNQGDQHPNVEEFYPRYDLPLKASRVSSFQPLSQQISDLQQQISDIGQDIRRIKNLDTINDDHATKPSNKQLTQREKNRLLLLKKLDQMLSTLTKLEPKQKPGLLASLWQLWRLRRQLRSAIKHTEQSSASYFPNTHGRLLATDKALRSLDSTYKNSFSEYRNKSNWLGLSLSASSLASIATATVILVGLGVATAGILPLILISSAIFAILFATVGAYNMHKITRNNYRYTKQQALQSNHNHSICEALLYQEPIGELVNEPIRPRQENVSQATTTYDETPAPKWASVNRVRHSQFFRPPVPVQIPNPDQFGISRTPQVARLAVQTR